MGKHTPGPWNYDGEIVFAGTFGPQNGELHSSWRNHAYIALMHDNPNWEANARLVSAAPDLYEAAKELVSLCYGETIVEPEVLTDLFRKLSLAVAKAEERE